MNNSKSNELKNVNKENDLYKPSFVIDALKLKEDGYFEKADRDATIIYNVFISKLEDELNDCHDRLKKYKFTIEDRVQQLIEEDDDTPLDDEEKKFIYDFYIKRIKKNSGNSIPYNALSDDAFEDIIQDLSIHFSIKNFGKVLTEDSSYTGLQESIDNLERQISQFKEIRDSAKLFSLDKNSITEENVNILQRYCKQMLDEGKTVMIGIDGDMEKQSNSDKANYLYSKEELALVEKLDSLLKSYGDDNIVKFNELQKYQNIVDFSDGWTLSEVVNANEYIDKICQHIKEKNLSPFESVLALHNEFSKMDYHQSLNIEEARVIVGAVNKKRIVCSGYSSLLKAVIDRLENPNLKCDIIGCSFFSKGGKGKIGEHTHNLVYINDEKYDINGYYACDITIDAGTEAKPYNFAHCMFPVGDLMNYRDMRYTQKFYNNRRDSLLFDFDNLKGILKSNVMYKLTNKFRTIKGCYFSRPQIVNKYEKESTPIPINKFDKALTSLNDKGLINFDTPQNVTKILYDTIMNAKETFNAKAINSFSLANQEDFQIKQQEKGMETKFDDNADMFSRI